MDGVSHVDGQHEALGKVGREIVIGQLEGVVDAAQDPGQDGGIGALFRMAAHFFVVKEGDDVQTVGFVGAYEGQEGGQDRRQVVQAGRRDEFVVPAEAAARFCRIDRQFVR